MSTNRRISRFEHFYWRNTWQKTSKFPQVKCVFCMMLYVVNCFFSITKFHLHLFYQYKFTQLITQIILNRFLITHLFYKQHFYKQHQTEIAKMKQRLSNTLTLNFYYLKIVHFLHPRYHPKVIGDILKKGTKNKCVCFNEVMLYLEINI